jgi:flagellar basal body-associated protein FliL
VRRTPPTSYDVCAPAARRRARFRLAAIIPAALALAGIVISMALPASASTASPVSARSAAAAARPAAQTASTPPAAFFGIGPASATQIDGRSYFAWAITPRGVLTDHAAVVNFGAQPVTLQVFATNAVSLAHGGTGFQSQGQSTGGPASWITLGIPGGGSTLQLPPKSKVIVPISVHIPVNASPGDHVGAIVAALTSTILSKNRAKVHLVQQVAARVILRVSGPLHPGFSVTGISVRFRNPLNPAASGTATLRFTVRNSGNVLLGGKQKVTVHGLFGSAESSKTTVSIPVMLPGGSASESATISGIYPELLMHGDVSISPVIVAGQYDPGLSGYSTSAGFWAIPWIPLAVVIVIVLAAAATIFWRRRRKRPGGGAAAGGETKPAQPAAETKPAEPVTPVEAEA